MTTPHLHAAADAELEDWGPLDEATGPEMTTSGVEVWADGDQSGGIWQCTPGPSHWTLETHEVIQLIAGRMTVTPDGGEPTELGAGRHGRLPARLDGHLGDPRDGAEGLRHLLSTQPRPDHRKGWTSASTATAPDGLAMSGFTSSAAMRSPSSTASVLTATTAATTLSRSAGARTAPSVEQTANPQSLQQIRSALR